MKTITIKVPHNIVAILSKRGQLNPTFFRDYLSIYVESDEPQFFNNPLEDGAMYYSFKLPKTTHEALKRYALVNELPITEYVGRLLHHYIEE